MKITVNVNDEYETLVIARNTLNEILARRGEKLPESKPRLTGQHPLVAETKTVPVEKQAAPETQAIPAAPAEPAPRGRGRPPKVTKTVTVEEVRQLMIDQSKQGGDDVMLMQRNLLASMGYKKLSDVPPEDLPKVKAKLEAFTFPD